MNTKYSLLNQYRIKKRMSMKQFARELGLDYFMVRKTLLGLSEPHDYNKVVFDEYWREHEEEILSVILERETVS